ncbi:SDR family oxidoreductase [Mycolicibacterium sp. XJ870]
MRVVMVGATGRYGHLVLDELLRREVWVRALVRSPQRVAAARDRGAHEAVVADLTRPDSLRSAVADMDGVFHIGPGLSPHEADMGTALVAAARAARVPKFVFSGVIHPTISALSNHAAKLPVEDALYCSGLDFTVLQPARFMQTLRDYWLADRDELAMPYSVTSSMSWVDYRDVAEVAAVAMTSDQLSHGTFELSSPGILDGVRTAAMLSEITGKHITAVHIPAAGYAQRLPQPHRAAFLRMMAYYDRVGLPAGNAQVLTTLLGRQPRTVQAFLRELTRGSTPALPDADHAPDDSE